MSAYAVAWLIAAVSAAVVALLICVALRRFRHWRFLVAALVLTWSLLPVSFDGEHMAPAFVVAVFRQFLEDDATAAPAWRLLLLATVALLGLYFAALGVRSAFTARRR